MAKDTYFEVEYHGPWKGIDSSLPENYIPLEASPSFQNFILKEGEIRTRPKQSFYLPGTPDGEDIDGIFTFMDSNGIIHTVATSCTGLWSLNPGWKNNSNKSNLVWSLIGSYKNLPGGCYPTAVCTFLNKFYFSNGDNNLWVWDGITVSNKLNPWQADNNYYIGNQIVDSNGNWQIVTQAGISGDSAPSWGNTIGAITNDGSGSLQWTENGKPQIYSGGLQSTAIVDATNGIFCGAYFLGELGTHLIMLNTLEGTSNSYQNFSQRVRWSPAGIPNIWDPNVNIGAGYEDLLETPDSITGDLFIGATGFIFRINGITEMSINTSSGTSPFNFNHLWASDHGIGNVFPFSIAGYGPIGIFISIDEIYEVSLGGFKEIGGNALTAIFNDINNATSTPIATIYPIYQRNYVYLVYELMIPIGNNTSIWRYSIKDKSWQHDFLTNRIPTGRPNFIAIS